MRKLAAIVLSILTSSVLAKLPAANFVPGGIAVIKLQHASAKPRVFFAGDPVLVMTERSDYYAVVGLPLTCKLGTNNIAVQAATQNYTQAFTVTKHRYPTSRITIKNQGLVDLSAPDMQRLELENQLLRAGLKTWSPQTVTALDFQPPINGIITTQFGAQRIINNQPKLPHEGLDIAAAKGTQIKPAASGTVVLVGDFLLAGKTVVLAHGQGLTTMYAHLNRTFVSEGQLVDLQTVIAEVGETGRATGPHLHFTVSLNGAKVNPALFTTVSP